MCPSFEIVFHRRISSVVVNYVFFNSRPWFDSAKIPTFAASRDSKYTKQSRWCCAASSSNYQMMIRCSAEQRLIICDKAILSMFIFLLVLQITALNLLYKFTSYFDPNSPISSNMTSQLPYLWSVSAHFFRQRIEFI